MYRKSEINVFIENLAKSAIMLDQTMEKFFKRYDITRVQFSALCIAVGVEGGIPLSTLGRQMGVSKANITTLIDRMENNGLVKRVPDDSDRRIIKVITTEKGDGLFEEILPERNKKSEELFGWISKEEMARANEILLKLQDILNEDI